jgi:hypothetical protein
MNRPNFIAYDVLAGALICFLILYLSGVLLFEKNAIDINKYLYFLLCAAIISFKVWNDLRVKTIITGISKSKNFEITCAALNKLNWKHTSNSTKINLTNNKFYLKLLDVDIEPQSNKIKYTFRYQSTDKGRLLFFFGIRTIFEWMLIYNIRKKLSEHYTLKNKVL